ncbi:MAG: TldD/PmbA family protein, partial [Candidatus Sumerlaeia bacterium]|nr:TldD/PmbA family protein [Candidatus Sumerlaeia bacterium]
MRALVLNTLSGLHKYDIDYADCRIVRRLIQDITVKNNYPEAVKYSESIGMGIRVLIKGAWGFAATADLSARAVNACARRAVAVARSSNRLPAEVPERLADNPVINDVY